MKYGFTSPPVADGDSWLYKFTTKGVYDVLCLPHLGLGMVMRLVVFDPEEDSLDDSMFDEWGSLPEVPSVRAGPSCEGARLDFIPGTARLETPSLSTEFRRCCSSVRCQMQSMAS